MTRLWVALACMAICQAGQAPRTIRFLEPTGDAAVSGKVTLRIAPAEGLASVVYQVDGREVCRAESAPFACEADLGAARVSHDLRAVARFTDGTRATVALRTPEPPPVFHGATDQVLVPVRVTDSRGRFVPGLTAAQFMLLDEGVARPVTVLDDGAGSAEILLVLDTSDSMSRVFTELQATVREFLGALRPQDGVRLASFNTTLSMLANRDDALDRKIAALAALKPSGFTAIYDTIIRAVEELRGEKGRRAIVLFTDGDDVASQATIGAARAALQKQDVMLYLIATGKAHDDGRLRSQWTALAEDTGGMAFFASRLRETAPHFREISYDFSRQYLLAFEPAKPLGDNSWHVLTVGTQERRLRVQARTGYLAALRSGR